MDDANHLDFAALAASVQRTYTRANHDDAEEAVSTAMEEGLRNGWRLTAANVVACAKLRLRSMFERRERSNFSLDAALEDTEEHAPQELAVEEVDFDAHATLAEAERHPVLAQRKRAAEAGASPTMIPRGESNRAARYTDAQVAEVRRLRGLGRKFVEIEADTGVEKSYAAGICRGRYRVLPTTEGWTRAKKIEVVKIFAAREGRAPTYQEAQKRPDLPNPSVLFEHGETWRQLLDRAGIPSTREWRRSKPWTVEEAVRVIWQFVNREGRWPRKRDFVSPLPAPLTAHNLFGTWSMREIQRIVEGHPSARGEMPGA